MQTSSRGRTIISSMGKEAAGGNQPPAACHTPCSSTSRATVMTIFSAYWNVKSCAKIGQTGYELTKNRVASRQPQIETNVRTERG